MNFTWGKHINRKYTAKQCHSTHVCTGQQTKKSITKEVLEVLEYLLDANFKNVFRFSKLDQIFFFQTAQLTLKCISLMFCFLLTVIFYKKKKKI